MTEQDLIAPAQAILRKFRACPEALAWAADGRSLQELWEECPDPEWLLLSVKGLGHAETPKLRLFAVACARRHNALFPSEACSRILQIAEAVGAGSRDQSHLEPAFEYGVAVADDAARQLEWNDSRNAAILCVQDSVRQRPWDAARRAARNGQRASHSAAREARWQVHELRRILAPDLPLLTQRARELVAGFPDPKKRRETRQQPRESPNGAVRQHLEEAGQCLDSLRQAPFQDVSGAAADGWCHRAEANLDGLRIAGKPAISTGLSAIDDEQEFASVVALLLAEFEFDQPITAGRAVNLLHHKSPQVRNAAWWGLRLANPRHVTTPLRALLDEPEEDFASAAAVDILAFHRVPVGIEIGRVPEEDGDEIAWLLAEAGGRMRTGAWTAAHMREFLGHVSPRVRAAALRASARCALPDLLATCREAAFHSEPREAIAFLGVVGSQEDRLLLQRVAISSIDRATAEAAVSGLGRLGLADAVPFLLECVDRAELADSASAAIQRIIGKAVPPSGASGARPGLPDSGADHGDPNPAVANAERSAWWRANGANFGTAKRYQMGICVSDDPLGLVFDQLPLSIRYDIYLRERALSPRTPDWELETWTWRQRAPGCSPASPT